MKEILVGRNDIRQLHPLFRGKYGELLIDLGIKITGITYANDIYDRSKELSGVAFCRDILDKLEIERTIRNRENLEKLNGQPFITVSNHPYGHIDGITLIETVGAYSPHFKLMVNQILGMIDTMAENFIVVNPHEKLNSTTLNGVKQCLAHVREGNPLGFFPSGAVSYMNFKNGKFSILDRDWQLSLIKLIRKAGVPVIPIHISGRNSVSFYLSRLLGWQVRNLRLCHELENKRGKEIVVTVGEAIMPESLKSFDSDQALGRFLKEQTYAT